MFTISTRTSRKEYWIFQIVNLAIILIFFNFDYETQIKLQANSYFNYSLLVISIALPIAQFTAIIRRLHDTGRSGFNILWQLLPVIGTIILLYYLVLAGDPKDNQYGPVPEDNR